jgi:hypothetical protein
MRSLMLVTVLLFAGCSSGINYIRDAADEVNKAGFDGKIVYSISYLAEKNVAADWHPLAKTIHLHPDWLWQPWIFVKGVIAHEMIHAYMDLPCPGTEDVDEDAAESPDVKTLHGNKFWVMRREVAEKLGIPRMAIPTGRKGTRLDAYWTTQYLEGAIVSSQNRIHGIPGPAVVAK